MNWYDELSELNEDAVFDASRKFWAAARMKQIDLKAFHTAFDTELAALGLMDIFTPEGTFKDRDVYGKIKAGKELHPDSWAVKALYKLWVLVYIDKIPCGAEAEAAEEARKAAAKAAEEKRLAAEKAAEEEAKAAYNADFDRYKEILKTYITKLDPKLITTYEQFAKASALEDIHLTDKSKDPWRRPRVITKLGIGFKSWGYFYTVSVKEFMNEESMLSRLSAFVKAATAGTQFKEIDVFNLKERSTVILLGESGALYKLWGNSSFGIKQADTPSKEADSIAEPFEVIYTCVEWSDHNNSTRSDSESAWYYSWNSHHVDKLNGLLPTSFGEWGKTMSYGETEKVTDPNKLNRNGYHGSPEYFSRAAGIDSWARESRVDVATD